ncbi:protein ANTI-SILENCING 1 isoform X2 [Mercurialis annua]|uniref:protein ANTI-SILENCING 1 isoform X2 n=1 Tax=Mercurialis annua TaxID=3986 RepID=UPI00215F078C|nr:protein ANTI-SILENCING 1 isoform X2 [Mercurialis annua]
MFKWGTKKCNGRTNKDIHFYNSFTYYGVEYCLYDCVYLHNESDVDTYIGKLVQMYETPSKENKVKVVWFFRPSEIRNFLGNYEPKWNELFLASGEGKGLSNVNPLEAIVDKCNVVCASNDERNPKPTEEELQLAEFVFYRSFHVGRRRILKNFADYVDGFKVEHFFNKRKHQIAGDPPVPNKNVKLDVDKSGSSRPVVKEPKVTAGQEQALNETAILRRRTPIDSDGAGRNKVARIQVDDNVKNKRYFGDSSILTANASQPFKKRKLIQNEEEGKVSDIACSQIAVDRGLKAVPNISTKPRDGRRRWFEQQPWEDKLQKAEEKGTLVLLGNLDPILASSEVEDLVWDAFKLQVEAKMVGQSTFSSPDYGKAFVVFESKDAAECALSKLQSGCLTMTDGRYLFYWHAYCILRYLFSVIQ